MHVEECVCVCMYACMCMYDVLIEIWGEGEGEKGLKPATNMRKESRLVLHEIIYSGTGMYPSRHIRAGVCVDVEDSRS